MPQLALCATAPPAEGLCGWVSPIVTSRARSISQKPDEEACVLDKQ